MLSQHNCADYSRDKILKKRKKKDLHLPVDLASSVQLVSIKKKKITPKKGGIRNCFKFNGFFKCMYVCGRGREGGKEQRGK